MSRTLNRLSARFVQTVVEAGRYADGGNLYLSVSPNGGRRWVFMFRFGGKIREMGLGSAREVSLAKARERAAEARAHLVDGRNPIAERATVAPDVVTFGKAADEFIAAREAAWSERTVAGWRWTLTEYGKPIRDKSVADIGVEDILGVLKPIWIEKPETARRVRTRIEAVLDACKVRGQRSGENPATWKANLAALLPAAQKLSRGHHAAMPYRDVPGFVRALREVGNTSCLALELAILTAARSGEIMGARWEEIDLADKLWRVPAARMKAKRDHVVPLAPRAIEILDQVRPDEEEPTGLVFRGARPGRPTKANRAAEKPLSSMALTMALRRAGGDDATVHGFRSSFRDWAGDETGFPRDVVEAALAHSIRDATEAAYRRATALEKRRSLMRAWGEFINGKKAGKVVSLSEARR
ncbi:tyrosine-type recombinase/integrase [Enterovirga rhinocerotis]|uniref:Integrase n=1 Tax=Enterovirga rhinocerotis TaxID=1339210 RepID=A0A4R7C750_9HYPH|nr:site-specific integrase [Enterovirga rhinocerotis]TDR93792.1 integrase [Enterovirga rhinocerotis]